MSQPSKKSIRKRDLKRAYGLTPDQYQRILISQNGVCAICRQQDPTPTHSLPVDHCHKTKKIRGLLCSRCNAAIGMMKDNPLLLRAAADYLEKGFTPWEVED